MNGNLIGSIGHLIYGAPPSREEDPKPTQEKKSSAYEKCTTENDPESCFSLLQRYPFSTPCDHIAVMNCSELGVPKDVVVDEESYYFECGYMHPSGFAVADCGTGKIFIKAKIFSDEPCNKMGGGIKVLNPIQVSDYNCRYVIEDEPQDLQYGINLLDPNGKKNIKVVCDPKDSSIQLPNGGSCSTTVTFEAPTSLADDHDLRVFKKLYSDIFDIVSYGLSALGFKEISVAELRKLAECTQDEVCGKFQRLAIALLDAAKVKNILGDKLRSLEKGK